MILLILFNPVSHLLIELYYFNMNFNAALKLVYIIDIVDISLDDDK